MATTPTSRRRKHWGWGWEDSQPSRADIELPDPRLEAPASLAEIVSADRHDRVSHAYGRAYRDLVRAFRGRIDNPPDLVARPRDEADVEAVLAWCSEAGAAAIPYGGGTSVVGGVEPRVGDSYSGAVTIDLGALDRVLEVDEASRAARIQAGTFGPSLEDQLRPHGLTLRHFPQSFEFSTLGGWIATRAGGHFATLHTHIDDLVESVRAITPSGEWESRRLPGSGAGPSPDRMLIGSEGTLGVITEAWVRLQERPRWKTSCGVAFDEFAAGAAAVRELSQSGLHPANCRLLDADESALTHAGPPGRALLVLGFESAHHPVDEPMRIALDVAREHGGDPGELRSKAPEEPGRLRDNPPPDGDGDDPVGAWRHAFLAAPYLRDTFVAVGVLSDTFETAITWDRFADFHSEVMDTARRAVTEVSGGPVKLSCRFTHVYPDGPAPYYTILAPAIRGGEVEQWDEIKSAASEAVISCGGTITHHHAVGRDHRPSYDRQRPNAFAEALRAAKRALDPSATLNPGVLIDPA
jgi:alkyldihydroxyacetonephosphate synthase